MVIAAIPSVPDSPVCERVCNICYRETLPALLYVYSVYTFKRGSDHTHTVYKKTQQP